MKINPKTITGNWDKGFVLDKHSVSSTHVGTNEHGHPQYETLRTDVGEALYLLKYKLQWGNIVPLAIELSRGVKQSFGKIDFIVPMAASNVRPRQPVTELAVEVGKQLGRPVNAGFLLKSSTSPIKNLNTRQEKDAALAVAFSTNAAGMGPGPFDILLVDDLIHSGASLDSACAALRRSGKIGRIYVAVLTWR
jgi:predicted amidophosphoribosyltransferase